VNQKRLKVKKHQRSVQLKALKLRRKRFAWLKSKNRSAIGRNIHQRQFDDVVKQALHLTVPTNFSIRNHPDEAFMFIARLKNIANHTKTRNVHISLRNCKYISNGAIALMISAIQELNQFGIRVSGNYPDDSRTKKILEKSGFFNFVYGNVSEENKQTINTIVQQGINVVEPEIIAPLVTQAMKSVWGAPYRNQRVQSLLIELMANSVNHAFKTKKDRRWYLSISHDNDNVSFTFIDNGQGICKTLNLKFLDKIKSLYLFSNTEIISAAFDGKFGSRTKERKRGRGLPNVKKCFSENYISNLVVITNNIYYDFKTNSTRKLKYEFDGTCYYWELNINCISWNNL